ncbi:hypothetical protein NQ317_017243 [Molorchus minor]|uniref:Uncharacterized protein n=1 Tax=Molorchus minor TaxID=1323400 RepID=A0ABQ9J0Z7_9CUCU|nr:hypothetical protein NQ317_017243 [Molorchus minor]
MEEHLSKLIHDVIGKYEKLSKEFEKLDQDYKLVVQENKKNQEELEGTLKFHKNVIDVTEKVLSENKVGKCLEVTHFLSEEKIDLSKSMDLCKKYFDQMLNERQWYLNKLREMSSNLETVQTQFKAALLEKTNISDQLKTISQEFDRISQEKVNMLDKMRSLENEHIKNLEESSNVITNLKLTNEQLENLIKEKTRNLEMVSQENRSISNTMEKLFQEKVQLITFLDTINNYFELLSQEKHDLFKLLEIDDDLPRLEQEKNEILENDVEIVNETEGSVLTTQENLEIDSHDVSKLYQKEYSEVCQEIENKIKTLIKCTPIRNACERLLEEKSKLLSDKFQDKIEFENLLKNHLEKANAANCVKIKEVCDTYEEKIEKINESYKKTIDEITFVYEEKLTKLDNEYKIMAQENKRLQIELEEALNSHKRVTLELEMVLQEKTKIGEYLNDITSEVGYIKGISINKLDLVTSLDLIMKHIESNTEECQKKNLELSKELDRIKSEHEIIYLERNSISEQFERLLGEKAEFSMQLHKVSQEKADILDKLQSLEKDHKSLVEIRSALLGKIE